MVRIYAKHYITPSPWNQRSSGTPNVLRTPPAAFLLELLFVPPLYLDGIRVHYTETELGKLFDTVVHMSIPVVVFYLPTNRVASCQGIKGLCTRHRRLLVLVLPLEDWQLLRASISIRVALTGNSLNSFCSAMALLCFLSAVSLRSVCGIDQRP